MTLEERFVTVLDQRQGSAIVDDSGRFFAGPELQHRIGPETYVFMA
jgi:hypothetical protein